MSTKTSNPGCLGRILRLLGLESNEETYEVVHLPADKLPYRIRDDFLSPAEQSFYQVIKNMMGEHFTICPKVSLADVFFVIRPNENRSAYNRINRKHVDFLICDPKTMRPRMAIELDDSSHQRADREERDEFVEEVFETAELPLIRIPVRTTYNTQELGVLFRQALRQDQSSSDGSPEPVDNKKKPSEATIKPLATQAPICPKCGEEMVLRTAKTGTQAGKQFYGCPNFPRCREVSFLNQ